MQFIVAMLAYALNVRMARKAEYLREENRVLKEAIRAATGKTQIPYCPQTRHTGIFAWLPPVETGWPRNIDIRR